MKEYAISHVNCILTTLLKPQKPFLLLKEKEGWNVKYSFACNKIRRLLEQALQHCPVNEYTY